MKKFRDEGKLPKDTKLNKKKDELLKLLIPFEEEMKTVEKRISLRKMYRLRKKKKKTMNME